MTVSSEIVWTTAFVCFFVGVAVGSQLSLWRLLREVKKKESYLETLMGKTIAMQERALAAQKVAMERQRVYESKLHAMRPRPVDG
jgi:hypothetical protein